MSIARISHVRFKAAPSRLVEYGVLGFVSCTVEDTLKVDGITLRRTVEGRLTLGFPARRDSTGQQRFYVQPVDDAARREIEQQVFRALSLEDTTS